MRYIIYGAGAVGGVVGACLFDSGREVVLIARGAHLTAMQQKGLRAEFPERTLELKIPAVAHPSEIEFRPDDVVFLTMKTQDTEAALEELEACAGNDIPVFCVQNGIENERLALRRFSRVYAVNVLIPANFMEPGKVTCSSTPVAGVLDIGCYPGPGVDSLIESVSAELNETALSSLPTPHIMRWKNAKLLRNLGNGLQAACGIEVNTDDLRAELEAEGRRVFEAAGIDHVTTEEFNERSRLAPPTRGGRGGSSGWQSVARGAGSVEADFLNGEIVLLGRLHGVPTPLNEAVRRAANRVARERLQPGAVTPAELRALAETV